VGGVVTSRLPEGADDPATWAADLDEWVVRHREAWKGGSDGLHPVSGSLPMAALSEEIVMALDQLHALQDECPSLTPEQKVAWQRRKTALLERITAARPDDGEARTS